MRFVCLRIRSFRGIAEVEVNFASAGITLVQGPNEIGKSSLGEAIRLLFDYPDSSKHRDVEAILPVHRDVGPEIELQAESGLYAFTYFKRFRKKPETRLTITKPKTESHTGRAAHERAMAILEETLDTHLWKALSIQQGEAVSQPGLEGQTSLSAALDKAAGGHPSDPRDEGLFNKVREEYLRYYTERGAEQKWVGDSKQTQADAQAQVAGIEQELSGIETDIERGATLQREITHLALGETELVKAIAVHNALLEEIRGLESAHSTALLRLESARKTEMAARRDTEARQSLIDMLAQATQARKDTEASSTVSLSAFNQAEEYLTKTVKSTDDADQRRRNADNLASLRRADFDHYSRKLHLEQLQERKERIDQARKSAAHAEKLLALNMVDASVLKKIENAEKVLLAANARLEMGAPNVVLHALGNCVLTIDGAEVRLGKGEVRMVSVPDRSSLIIPGKLDIEIAAGSSADGLARKADDALRDLQDCCQAAGVADAQEARLAFEKRREANRQMESKGQIEKENLRDLTYEDLQQRLHGLELSVPDYIPRRVAEPAICPDRDSAQTEWTAAQAAQQQANAEWDVACKRLEAARQVREARNTEHQDVRVKLNQAEKDLLHAQESLDRARNSMADDDLHVTLDEAVRAVKTEEANVRGTEASLAAKNPDRVKALAETAKGSLARTTDQRSSREKELIGVQTRLKIHGEEGLHEKLHMGQVRLERLELENKTLLARAAAAKRLFETMREERDKSRQAYVAPLKARIEGLGRLVFDDSFKVNIDDDLQIESRTLDGVTVPFGSLSGGTREQLSLIMRLTCSMIVAKDGGVPIILDDALGYTDPERLRLMGVVLARAAKECQIIIFTCVPDRYANIGEAAVVSLK